jgi:hypothetical protein
MKIYDYEHFIPGGTNQIRHSFLELELRKMAYAMADSSPGVVNTTELSLNDCKCKLCGVNVKNPCGCKKCKSVFHPPCFM